MPFFPFTRLKNASYALSRRRIVAWALHSLVGGGMAITLKPMMLTLIVGFAFASADIALASEDPATTRPAMGRLSISLDQPATTSAGDYDSAGRLVRVVWSM